MSETNYCAVCGWRLAESFDEGCVRGNCSMRPVPEFWTDPDRALAEGYSAEAVERHRRPQPAPCPRCASSSQEAARLREAVGKVIGWLRDPGRDAAATVGCRYVEHTQDICNCREIADLLDTALKEGAPNER